MGKMVGYYPQGCFTLQQLINAKLGIFVFKLCRAVGFLAGKSARRATHGSRTALGSPNRVTTVLVLLCNSLLMPSWAFSFWVVTCAYRVFRPTT
jgi:hypothetical protein